MEPQASASAQIGDQRAPVGLSGTAPTPAASPASAPRGRPVFPSAPRGPRRGGLDGPGARSAAEEFGLDWDSARPPVRAVAEQACARVPQEWEVEGPGVCLSLGDATDLDPALMEAMLGPDGLSGQFGQDAAADALRPGPVLAALTEAAVADGDALGDDEMTGAIHAARREEARARWKQTTLVARFARRRAAQLADAKAAGIPAGRRPGEFPDDELAAEFLVTRSRAADRIEADLELTGRLPRTLAGLADGTISADRADTIAAYTGFLSDDHAAQADEILAAAAPGLRVDQLARRAAALEMKLDPAAARTRKEHARDTRQRVEVRREFSGNASLSGRELDTADALASKAYIDAMAVRLRNLGRLDDPLSAIRARVLTELTQGRDPLSLILPGRPRAPRPATAGPSGPSGPAGAAPGDQDYPCCPGDPDDPGPSAPDAPGADSPDPDGPRYAGPAGRPSWDPDEADDARRHPGPYDPPRRGFLRPGQTAPLPAAINLLIPIGTLLGWSTAPAHANGIGLLDPADTQAITHAASRHPRTRWCATITNPDGTAAAHACAPGQHPWTPPPRPPDPATCPPEAPPGAAPPAATGPPPRPAPGESPDAAQLARLHELLTQLNLAPDPIARGDCDHHQAEPRYTPSRKLKHLLRARTSTCDAPGCNNQAVYCDQDHTTPWPDGPTCQCNLGPKCRRHHRAKQAPGWHVEQPQPGVIRWTLPNGRTHTTTPTAYDP